MDNSQAQAAKKQYQGQLNLAADFTPPAIAICAPELKWQAMRRHAVKLYRQSLFREAIEVQLEVVNASKLAGKLVVDDLALLAGIFVAMGDTSASLAIWQECVRLEPENLIMLENYAIALKQIGQLQQSNEVLLAILSKTVNSANVFDILADNYTYLQQWDLATQYGLRSLQLKDQQNSKAKNLQELSEIVKFSPRAKFNQQAKNRNIIAFSLWGNNARYLVPAIQNVIAARSIYPHWTCRFYYDQSVPASVIEELRHEGAQLVLQPNNQLFQGLFWRFQVANDANVDFFLVRDADAVVNAREKNAVDLWLQSDQHFHLMRDFYTHSELILAGMWGGVAGVLPHLETLWNNSLPGFLPMKSIDQQFLRQEVWPIIKHSNLTHDSIFKFLGEDFPEARNDNFTHVGQAVLF